MPRASDTASSTTEGAKKSTATATATGASSGSTAKSGDGGKASKDDESKEDGNDEQDGGEWYRHYAMVQVGGLPAYVWISIGTTIMVAAFLVLYFWRRNKIRKIKQAELEAKAAEEKRLQEAEKAAGIKHDEDDDGDLDEDDFEDEQDPNRHDPSVSASYPGQSSFLSVPSNPPYRS
ncbi:hypothetical protein EMMF5_000129 [Cystobasidiomycetes sp. EMM_F5]